MAESDAAKLMRDTVDVELVRELTHNLRGYLAPHLDRWLDTALAAGASRENASAAVAIEAMMLACCFHVGSDTLFMEMARKALECSQEPPPTEH